MITDVTLTAEEFKLIHNALCDIRHISEYLEPILNTATSSKLSASVANIAKGLENAYRQENDEFDSRSQHYDKVAAEHNFKAIWSMHEISDLNINHTYANATHVGYTVDGTTHMVPINGHSWVSLWAAADKLIDLSGDDHHIFIEDFHEDKNVDGLLILSTGS